MELKKTESVCPECLKILPATLHEAEGKVWIRKVCPEHGEFEELYSGSSEWYRRIERYTMDGRGIENPQVTKEAPVCPKDCGLCNLHMSHTALANIIVTNRCDLVCWYCLPGDETVMVDGLGPCSLGELAERVFSWGMTQPAGEGESHPVSGIRVLGLLEGRIDWVEVVRVYRRRYSGRILEIKTSTGKCLRVTEDHLLIVLREGKLIRQRAGELAAGDVVLTMWRSPEMTHVPAKADLPAVSANLTSEEVGKKYVRGVRELLAADGGWKDQVHSWEARDSIPLPTLRLDLRPRSRLLSGKSITRRSLPSRFKISPELMELIGLFIANGHYTSKDLRITTADSRQKRRIIQLIETGFPHSVLRLEKRGKAPQVIVKNRNFRSLVEHVLEIPGGAENKRLPSIAFGLPLEFRIALLSGLFSGKGCIIRGGGSTAVAYTTVSRGLARDLLYLLAQLGIFCRLEVLKKEKGAKQVLYKIYLSGEDAARFLSLLHPNERPFRKMKFKVTPAKMEKLGDLVVDRVVEVVETRHEGYVYDIEVADDTHTFLAGDGVLISNCFYYAQKLGYVYEPTLAQVEEMLRVLKEERPIPCNAIQLTGGEPCLRDDLIDIIKLARSYDFDHIQLNTNGLRLAHDPELAKKVRGAGVNTLYLSFDGVSEKTNPKNHWEFPLVVENCRKAGLGIVLVPTVIKGVNDHEVGAIVRYAFRNLDIIRSVNFQPVSLVGRMPREERDRYRITIPDVIKKLEEQTNGEITLQDFFPVPTALIISRFIEALTGKMGYDLSSHFACGAATYVFRENGKMIPLTRFIDVEGFLEYLKEKTGELERGKSKTLMKLKLLASMGKFIDARKKPKDLKISKILYHVFVKRNYGTLGQFHAKSLFIGMMHFMDLYNYDLERVRRCCIHYVMSDRRVVPFCAFNVIPEWYRDKDQESQGIPVEEWERRTGRKLRDDLYKRDVEKLRRTGAYRKFEQVVRESEMGL